MYCIINKFKKEISFPFMVVFLGKKKTYIIIECLKNFENQKNA